MVLTGVLSAVEVEIFAILRCLRMYAIILARPKFVRIDIAYLKSSIKSDYCGYQR